MTSKLKKNFLWNTIGSVLNAFTSLLFLIIVTRINGIAEAGIFTFAFSTACLLQVIGIYAGRTYQVTEANSGITDSDYLYNRVISCFVMIIIGIAFSIFKKYEFYKILIIIFLVIYKAIEAFSESIYAIIQKNDDLYKVGISLVMKSILGLLTFFIVDFITKNVLIAIIVLIIPFVLVTIFYDIKNLKRYHINLRDYKKSSIFGIFKFGFWTFLFTFLTQYVINAPKYAIDNFLVNDAQTIYGIIAMPATLMILCSQFLIHPFLVSLTNNLKHNNIKNFRNLVLKIMFVLLLFGIMANIVAYFIGIPFLELIYGISLKDYLKPLIIIITGAVLFGMSYILSNALIAMRKTLVQSIIFLIASIFAYLASNYLVPIYMVGGASVSYFLTMALILIFYLIIFAIEVKKYKKDVGLC